MKKLFIAVLLLSSLLINAQKPAFVTGKHIPPPEAKKKEKLLQQPHRL
jgi:hypothetical protein